MRRSRFLPDTRGALTLVAMADLVLWLYIVPVQFMLALG
jgi:hypothetical protein